MDRESDWYEVNDGYAININGAFYSRHNMENFEIGLSHPRKRPIRNWAKGDEVIIIYNRWFQNLRFLILNFALI